MRQILGGMKVATMARWCYRRNKLPIGGVWKPSDVGLYFRARRPHISEFP